MSDEFVNELAEALAKKLEERYLEVEGDDYRELIIQRNINVLAINKLEEDLKIATARIAELESLVERLVEAGEGLTDFILIDTRLDEEKWDKWIEVRAEWRAMKGGVE